MAKSETFLSVVIPAYNEAANFKAGVLRPVVEYLKQQKYAWEVIFVDDGSTDETNQLLNDLSKSSGRIKLIKIPHAGKAAAVTAGILAAKGEIVLFTDFDQSTPITEVNKFVARHRAGADVVIAVRNHTEHDTWVRRVRSWAFVKLVQLVALAGIKDSQCGFKSFTRLAAQKIFTSLLVSQPSGRVKGGYMGAFDVEVLFLARKFGHRIDQVPVHWTKVFSDKLNLWREPLLMAIDTFKVRLYDILGKYGE